MSSQTIVRKTVSLPTDLFTKSQKAKRPYESFSSYVARLLDQELGKPKPAGAK